VYTQKTIGVQGKDSSLHLREEATTASASIDSCARRCSWRPSYRYRGSAHYTEDGAKLVGDGDLGEVDLLLDGLDSARSASYGNLNGSWCLLSVDLRRLLGHRGRRGSGLTGCRRRRGLLGSCEGGGRLLSGRDELLGLEHALEADRLEPETLDIERRRVEGLQDPDLVPEAFNFEALEEVRVAVEDCGQHVPRFLLSVRLALHHARNQRGQACTKAAWSRIEATP
jgi:hypothetical protein